jgi:hypothetical protein
MFSKEAQELAPKVYEAIKKITGKERECPKCKGSAFACKLDEGCDGTGKVKGKWEWEPEVGEWYIWEGIANVICQVWDSYGLPSPNISIDNMKNDIRQVTTKRLIPLLHWERIRKILKQFDYSFSITSGASGGEITVYKTIGTNKLYEKYHNNDLQCAVMRAVIELGKEV